MRVLAVLLSLSLLACGGAPFSAGNADDGGLAEDSGSIGVAPDASPEAAAQDSTPAMADTLAEGDAGALREAAMETAAPEAAAPDAAPDVAPDVPPPPPPTYCCVSSDGSTTLGTSNVHCGIGARAQCGSGGFGTTTYNSASCSSMVIGTTCESWPQSYGSPQACGSSEPCCYGTVQVCP